MLNSIISSKIFKTAMKVMFAVVDEATVNADENGLHFCAVDPAHVAVIKMDISNDSFVQYECDKEIFAIDLEKINSVIGLIKNDTLSMSLIDGRLVLTFDNIRRSMNIIDPSECPNMPCIEVNDAKLTIDAGQLTNAVKAGQNISNAFRFIANESGIRMIMEDDGEDCEVFLDMSTDINADASVQFPVDYFIKLMKSIPADIDVELKLATDKPMILSFNVDAERSNVTYMLAPRL